MNMPAYKSCSVPLCRNSTVRNPDKLFLNVPKSKDMRKEWLTLARRDPKHTSDKSTIYFCEDHFDLPNDMENYMQYHVMGFVNQIRLKPGCVPTKFECQLDQRKHTSVSTDSTYVRDEEHRMIIEECLREANENLTQCSGLDNVKVETSSDVDNYEEISVCYVVNKAVQAKITHKFRSKATQVDDKMLENKAVSSLRFAKYIIGRSLNSRPSVSGVNEEPKKLTIEEEHLHSDDPLYTPSSSRNSESNPSIPSFSLGSTSDCSEIDREKQKQITETIQNIMNKPRFYVGVPNNCYYLIDIISNEIHIPKEHLLLCLKKVRLNSNFQELADEFAMTPSCATKIFSKDIPLVASGMRPFIVKLDRKLSTQNLPMPFRHKYSNVSCIIYCLEIEIQKPSKAVIQALTWSEYKQAHTIKYLISCTPNGLVNYISPGVGGRVTDTCLVELCDFIQCLERGMCVLADRGFKDLEKYLSKFGIKLVQPQSKTGAKLTKNELKINKQIESLRIHMEKVISRLSEFCILKPHDSLNLNYLKILDDIVRIACALINLYDTGIK